MYATGLKTIPLQDSLPKYGHPVNHSMIAIEDGKLMATMVLNGIPFESASSKKLLSSFTLIKTFFNQLAKKFGNDIAIWTHIVKSKDSLKESYKFNSNFVQSFSDQYLKSFSGETFFKTSYYITFVYKYGHSLDEGEAELFDLLKLASSVFKSFDSEILKLSDDFTSCSNIEFLSYLMNNKKKKIPLSSSKVVDTIAHSDWHFGYDILEIRNADTHKSRYASFYEVDSFPLTTHDGMWDFILKQNCEFVLTQSMIMAKSHESLKKINEQINLIASSDNAAHEIEELENATDYVATGEIGFGDYHCSLAVFGDTQQTVIQSGADITGEFMARSTLLKRSNLKSHFTFLSMLPSSNKRILPSPRTTTNLACTWSLHNYSSGKRTGNPIGDGSALIPLKTTSNTLFYLNCHASELNQDVRGKKYAGHTLTLGASGAGKTTLLGTIIAFLTRFNPQIFCIDYNRSTELFIRAFGGNYYTIREGVDTGLNPFQLPDTPELRGFLNRLVYRISADNDGFCTEEEEAEIKAGIDTVMRLDISKRGLSLLLQSIQSVRLRSKLGKWCRSENGQYAWCLDSATNTFDPNASDIVGFDSTMLLEIGGNGEAHIGSEPILATLFYLKELMQKQSRLMATIVEEFWMPANFPLTQSIMKKTLKAGRLKGEFMLLNSQSPEDAINCDIFAAIVQQTATKIFLPNPEAEKEGYLKCNMTAAEFEKFSALDKLSRTFLVKQSNNSCFAKLDLQGFDDFLPIISGTDEDILVVEKIREKYGKDCEVWIPKFQQYLRNKRAKYEQA